MMGLEKGTIFLFYDFLKSVIQRWGLFSIDLTVEVTFLIEVSKYCALCSRVDQMAAF